MINKIKKLFYPYCKCKNEISILMNNITKYNVYNPNIYNLALKKCKQDKKQYNILYDSAIRLYIQTGDNSFVKKFQRTYAEADFSILNFSCFLEDMDKSIVSLRNVFLKNINDNTQFSIDIKNNKLYSSIETKKCLEINLPIYILDKNSSLPDIDKEHLGLFYREVLLYCKENDILILPIFTYKWLVDYKSVFKSDLYFLHHAKINNEKQVLFKKSYLPGYFYLNDTGFSGWYTSSFSKNKVVDKFYEEIKGRFVITNISKYKQPDEDFVKPDNDKKIIFVAMQTAGDVVGQLSYLTTLNLLKAIVNICKKDKNMIIVVKRHPCCKNKNIEKYIYKISKYQNVIISKANIKSLLNAADIVCTVNSGVGFESLLRLKKVILSGISDYKECCFEAKNLSELKFHIYSQIRKSDDEIKNFLFHYLNFDNIHISNLKIEIHNYLSSKF